PGVLLCGVAAGCLRRRDRADQRALSQHRLRGPETPVVYDPAAGTLQARPGAQRLAATSGGTIPDRGMFGVFLAAGEEGARRVGELDEEMVYESRVGDVFTLGASSWRITEINRDQVIVVPAAGHTGRLP